MKQKKRLTRREKIAQSKQTDKDRNDRLKAERKQVESVRKSKALTMNRVFQAAGDKN